MNAFRRRPTPAWHVLITALAVLGLALSSACAGTPPPPTLSPPTATPLPPTPTPVPTLKDIADEIAADVGQVTTVVEADPDRVIFVFEELHVSRLGQVQIAIMLNRLYENYDLRHIGLEGYPAAEPPLDLAWAHGDPPFQAGDLITNREDIIVQTLQDGEISSAELMGLIYSDAVINGVDDADLYAYEPPAPAWNAPYNYLYQIAFAGMTDAERSDWQFLYDQGKNSVAYKFAIATDDFTAEKYAAFTDVVNVLPAQGWLDALAELKARAGQVGAAIPLQDQANLEAMITYFERSEQRSAAMAANMLALAEAEPGAPLAMTVGAGHTARLVELFTRAGVSFVVLRSQSMAENNRAGMLSPEAYERKKQGLSVDPDGWLGSFLDGRKKPPPVTDSQWYRQGIITSATAQSLAEQANELAKSGYSSEEITNRLNAGLQDLLTSHPAWPISHAEVVAVYLTEPAPFVSFHITLQGGGELWGGASLIPDAANGDVEFGDRLDQSKTNIEDEPPPATTGQPAGTQPQQVCSNTQVIWSDTASVHVTPGQLARVDVTPPNVTLGLGEQQQFSGTGYDAAGNPVPITPQWTTTGGGTLSNCQGSTCTFTATLPGDFTISAQDSGTGIIGSAKVHVRTGGVSP